MAYDKVGNGTLSANKYKKTDSQPSYTGKITIHDVEYKLSAFLKEGQWGPYLSLSVETKNDEAQATTTTAAPKTDFIPF